MADTTSLLSVMEFVKSEDDDTPRSSNNAVAPLKTKISKLSYELHGEVRKCTVNTTISKRLRDDLENYSREIRREIVKCVRDNCTPLLLACSRGCLPIVEYLVSVCDADIEQRGLFESLDDHVYHLVTPLWCAVVVNNLPIVKYLLKAGSDINAVSDTGSTPVRSACYMTHYEMVKFLVANGADIERTNISGGTCLINSVQSRKLCLFLIRKGCDVNAVDIQGKTALHYAIQEQRLDTTKLLIEHGADPYAVNCHGDDALRTACLKGVHHIFDYLSKNVAYPLARLADAHELMGSTFLDEHNESRVAVLHWRLAYHLRATRPPYIEKLPIVPLREAFGYVAEYRTLEELDNISTDIDALRIQSLIICERILGISHKCTLFRLTYRGASYADCMQPQKCIQLWLLLLETRVQHNSLLYFDTTFAAQFLVRLMLELNDSNQNSNEHNADADGDADYDDEKLPYFKDVLQVFKLLTETVRECQDLLQIRPISRRQQDNFDNIIKCIAHTIYLLLATASSPAETHLVRLSVRKLVQANITTALSKNSLLHLCVSRLNIIKSFLTSDRKLKNVFPNAAVVKLLLECGMNVDAKNEAKSTALHIAAQPGNFNNEIISILLDHGADLDRPNKMDERPYDIIAANPKNTVPLMNYRTLKCLAATVISKYRIPYHHLIPNSLEIFVKQHEP